LVAKSWYSGIIDPSNKQKDSKMTKKHFIAMADAFRQIQSYEARNAAVVAFSEVSKQFNANFDVIQFRLACHV